MCTSSRFFARGAAAALVLLALTPASSTAQYTEPDLSKARLRIGPVMLNPTVELRDFGVDTNVFNEPADQAKRDVAFTFSPRTDLWMRVGRTWMTGNVREDILWYKTYASERTANTGYSLTWLVPLNHLRFNVGTSFLSARDRPGFEIDARAQRKEVGMKGEAEIRVLSKTFIGVRGSQQRTDFDSTATYLGSSLRSELNRTVTAAAVTLKHELTPLTSITIDAGRAQDRFELSSLRDANSTDVGVQVTFDPSALLKGSARIGYKDFQPLVPGVPSYQGATAAVDLAYVLLGVTRFSVQAMRDISYSYDVQQPYYLQTGFQATLQQQVFGPVDVVGRAGRQNLAYRDREGAVLQVGNRTDVVHSYGGGLGYHLGDAMRVGVNIDRQKRRSEILRHEYDGMRFGATVTYGF